jgi:hypothetical protein
MSVTPEGQVFITGGYQGTAVFDAITLHSAGDPDIFLAELKANPDDDNCKGRRCGEQDDDNRGNHGHGGEDND